eukprot:NODE_10_length_47437_cov_0.363429.p5 type:complete len:626 gc:universal NODE_10_length_47437_cov_0.363429:34878-33001(-)
MNMGYFTFGDHRGESMLLIDVLKIGFHTCVYVSIPCSSTLFFEARPAVDLYTGRIELIEQIIPQADRAFACFVPDTIRDIVAMHNDKSSFTIHLHQPVIKHLNNDHLTARYSSLDIDNHLKKRFNLFSIILNEALRLLGLIGHTFISFLQHIAKSMHFGAISRTMQFYHQYFKLTVPVIQESIPLMHMQLSKYLSATSASEQSYGIPKTDNDNSTLSANSDGRIQLIRDVISPHLSRFNFTGLYQKYADISKNITIARLPNSPPDVHNPSTFLGSLHKMGKEVLSSVVEHTSVIIPEYIDDMYHLISAELHISEINQFMKTHGIVSNFSLLSLFTLIVSTEATYTYMYHMGEEPFTESDISSVLKVGTGFELSQMWLFDNESGEATPMKEYNIITRLDWFPRIYSAILQQLNLLLSKTIPSAVYSAIYTLDSYIIALCVYPVSYKRGNESRNAAIESTPSLTFGIWYLWAYSCVLHLARTPLTILDPLRVNELQKWFALKALTVGVPQAFLTIELTNRLRRHLDFKNPVHSQHFIWNILGWTSDAISTMVPYYHGFDKFDVSTTLMVIGYNGRINYMMKNGIPGVIPYYDSVYRNNSSKAMKISLESRYVDPSVFWKEKDPINLL